MDDRVGVLERALARAKRRLRLRSLTRAGAVGLQVGLALAIPAAVTARLLDAGAVPAALAAVVVASSAVALSLLVGMLTPVPDRRAVALLVDRLGATEELLLTALHVVGSSDPNRDAILGRLDPARLPDPKKALPIRAPRHLRYALLPLPLVVAAVLAVPPAFEWPGTAEPDVVAEEGDRIAERLADPSDPVGEALPEELRRELQKLADDLQGSDLTPEEARMRLEDAQEQLEALQQELARSGDLLEELEKAAAALDEEATRELGDALRDGDLDAAAEAARDLSEDLAEASPEERQRAAESLTQAGSELKKSSDPTMKGMGEAMERAGQAAAGEQGQSSEQGAPGEQGQPGQQGEPGEQGQPGQQGQGMSPADAQALAQELERARELGEQLKRDQQAMQRSQELNGALESSRQRLGGEPQVAEGEGQEDGEGEGQGEGQGEGEGAGGEGEGPPGQAGTPGREAGASGHTWEDEGEFAGGGKGEDGAAEDRQSEREGGEHVDDFQKLYEGVRLDGAKSLLTSVEGQLDEDGQVDQLPIRLTEAEEAAKTGTIDLPARYAEEAAEAIEAEPIPPAYKEAVKRYFDAMD